MGPDAIDCAKEHNTLISSTNSASHNPVSTKKQKTSISLYRAAVTGDSVAKVCNCCYLNAFNQEHHNWSNCLRRSHSEFDSQEHVVYDNLIAGRIATTRTAKTGLTNLLPNKTYPAPNNNEPAELVAEAVKGMTGAIEVLLHVPLFNYVLYSFLVS